MPYLMFLRVICRGLALFVSRRPKTPLRALCIIAFDVLHVMRFAKPMPQATVKTLVVLLDFAASANALLDDKQSKRDEFHATRNMLKASGLCAHLDDYERRLLHVERTRPRVGGLTNHFESVRNYREEVVRLSLAVISVTAGICPTLDDAIQATRGDPQFNLLFRIVMQCQIMDDTLDYSIDLSAHLPSFLTACSTKSFSLERTHAAARQ